MRANSLILLLLVFCCGTFSNVAAKAPVWKVSKGQEHLYLGGTIHVLSKSDYPLPESFDKAFDNSQQLVFEIDIAQMSDPMFAEQFKAVLTYQDEQTLKGALSDDTYQMLQSYLEQRSLAIELFAKTKPVGVSLSLLVIEMQRLSLSSAQGVDQFYHQQAIKHAKQITALETVQEQMSFISQMGLGNEDALIESTLQDLDGLEQSWPSMSSAWRSGDTNKLDALLVEEMQQDFPEIYRLLLQQRNNSWMEKIIPMFATKEVEFILVGALHMVGDHGLLEQLAALGYTVEQLN